jgi:hypothetical protein
MGSEKLYRETGTSGRDMDRYMDRYRYKYKDKATRYRRGEVRTLITYPLSGHTLNGFDTAAMAYR